MEKKIENGKRIGINRETLRRLSADDLAKVQGGKDVNRTQISRAPDGKDDDPCNNE